MKPSRIDTSDLSGLPPPRPMNAGERQELDGEEFGRPEPERDLGEERREQGDEHHREERAHERRREGSGQSLAALTMPGHGIAIERGRH